jgi:hypothetical protein
VSVFSLDQFCSKSPPKAPIFDHFLELWVYAKQFIFGIWEFFFGVWSFDGGKQSGFGFWREKKQPRQHPCLLDTL